ncbi:MAG: hypothetical protein E2O68_03730 [Deltaproteobacteria bacterium]|nr:MAG: hypothetical protein E2O68_03730 [Deltaproteobacteria bacterium]
MNSNNGPIVALLIDDPVETEKLSSLFKRMGFTPECYEDLEVFWNKVEKKRPSLSIVDVKLMSKGEVILKDHPLILNDDLPIAFYYSDETAPLTISTYEIFHMGLVKKSVNYAPALKCALKRAVKYWSFKGKSSNLNIKLQKSVKRSLQDAGVRIYLKMIKSWLIQKNEKDFFHASERVISHWPEVEQYTWLCLDSSGQKLISPKISAFKFIEIPAITLGKNHLEGIDPLAEDMGKKVVEETLEGETISLKIKGNKKYPEILMFFKVHKSLKDFNFKMLEEFLGVFYLSFKGRNNFFEAQKKMILGPWELFSLLDENMEIHGKKYSMIDVNFSSHLKVLMDHKNRFYWNKFLMDFCTPVREKFDFNVSCTSPGHLTFLTDWKNGNALFEYFTEAIKEFPFWKYFEEGQELLAGDFTPRIKMVPPSVRGLLSHLAENSPFSGENSISRSEL